MNLPEIAIRRPVFAWMMMAGLILFGLISADRMGISQLPDVDFPVVSVRVEWPGAAPEVVETNVVDVIEDAVMTVEGVRSVTSTSRCRLARVPWHAFAESLSRWVAASAPPCSERTEPESHWSSRPSPG